MQPDLTCICTQCTNLCVPPEQYREALTAAIREYEALGAQRREIDERLAQLAQTIGTLNRLCGFVSTVPWGLTDACRVVLKAARRDMTPTEVRDRLEAIGFPLTRYTNSLAAIHTVLKRLHDAAEVLFVERPGRRFACEWRPSVWSVVVSEQELMATLAPPTGVIPDAPRRTRGRK
jgi:hypothetical protein